MGQILKGETNSQTTSNCCCAREYSDKYVYYHHTVLKLWKHCKRINDLLVSFKTEKFSDVLETS